MKDLQSLAPEERKEAGRQLNLLKDWVEKTLEVKEKQLAAQALKAQLAAEVVDITLPGKRRPIGHIHPLTQVQTEIEDIFGSMGYSIEDGPEIDHLS
jgi:phenylalanyl-tRNA synthetase alpha chain